MSSPAKIQTVLPAASCENCGVRRLCLPVALDAKDLDRMEELVRARPRLERGDYLYWAGDAFNSLYAVKSGAMKTFGITSDGEEQLTGFFFPGEVVGLDAIDNGIYNCNAVALADTQLCEIPYARLDDLGDALPALPRELTRILSRELLADCKMLTMVGRMTAGQRIACFLFNLSGRLADHNGGEIEHIELPMSREDIANYLGLTIETVSRKLGELKKQGLIGVAGRRVDLLDRDGLAEICPF
ncbi:MAG: helix-turn-helix domain-containing protein [Gammaproteobacteria bacterium]|nr:helix-turn-helix domain-containing protein [Gammaproteobacteria bacterium]